MVLKGPAAPPGPSTRDSNDDEEPPPERSAVSRSNYEAPVDPNVPTVRLLADDESIPDVSSDSSSSTPSVTPRTSFA